MRAPQERTFRTRAALIAAARAIAAETGLSSLRAEAVVQRAGTAKGTFFAHFPDKDHLVATLLAERLRDLPSPPPARDDREAVEGMRPLLRLMVGEPGALPLMARFSTPEGDGTGMGEAIHALIAALAGRIAGAQAEGGIRRADPALLAEGMMAFAFHAAASALCSEGAGEGPAEARAMAHFGRLAGLWLAPE